MSRTVLKILTLLTLLITAAAQAGDGLQWLTEQVQNGYPTATATAYQAGAEALTTVYRLDGSLPDADLPATGYADNTELLARRIIAATQTGSDTGTLMAELLSAQDAEDGGFGSLPGYPGMAADTAFALRALTAAGQSGSQAAAEAVAFLAAQQAADGGWDGVYSTALAAAALLPYRTLYALDDVLREAAGFLLSRTAADGSAGEDFETALVLRALRLLMTDSTDYQASADYLSGVQQADGSWGGDVYTTALALQAMTTWKRWRGRGIVKRRC